MTLTIIIEEYYNLICEMNYLLIVLNGVLEDDENIQFIKEKILINDNFKHIDIDNILKYLQNSVDNDLNFKLIKYLKNLIIFAEKYNVNSFEEIEDRILTLWEHGHIYDETLLKYVIRIDSDNLYKIYIDMVRENLIKDPNVHIGTSSEPLFTMLPKKKKLLIYNLKIIASPLVNWTILKNGTIPLEHFIYEYETAKDKILKKYFHDIIMSALKGNLCVFNNRYFKRTGCSSFEKVTGLYLLSLYDVEDTQCLHNRLSDDGFIKEINEYLLSDEGYNHQLKLYKEHNLQGDRSLNQIKLVRKNRNFN
mgnify:FL=1